jgi:ABC-type amino acid transport substrate-binding protein
MANAQSKTITIQTIHYPPYINLDENKKVSGISYYLSNEIFKSAGYKVTFNIVPYQRAVHNLFKKKDGIMTGIFSAIPNYQKLNLTQVSFMGFPTAYFYNSKTHPEYGKITNLKQTKGKNVAVMAGTKVYEDVITNSGGKLIKVTNEKGVFKMLKAGRVDFAHSALLSTIQTISKDSKLKHILPLKFNATNMLGGIVFREGALSAKNDFIKEVKKLHKNGKLLEIFKNSLKNLKGVDAKSFYPKEIKVQTNIPK